MIRFSLRTLILVMLFGGPVLAGMWWFRGPLLAWGGEIMSGPLTNYIIGAVAVGSLVRYMLGQKE